MNFRAAASWRISFGTTNLFEGTVSSCEPGLIRVQCAETGGELMGGLNSGTFTVGQRVWVALRPEKVRLGKQPVSAGPRQPAARHGLGARLPRQSLHLPDQDRDGKLVTVFAQNERRNLRKRPSTGAMRCS